MTTANLETQFTNETKEQLYYAVGDNIYNPLLDYNTAKVKVNPNYTLWLKNKLLELMK